MYQHSNTICIWSIYFSVYAIFQSLWFMSCFRDRCLLLTRKILNRGVLVVKLTSSLRKLCGGHHDLVNQIFVSQITCHLVFKKSNTTGVSIGDISFISIVLYLILVRQVKYVTMIGY
jgi:hypothetical protein